MGLSEGHSAEPAELAKFDILFGWMGVKILYQDGPKQNKISILLKGYSLSDLVWHFHKVKGLTRGRLKKKSMQQWTRYPDRLSMGQAPETLDPKFLLSN